jgi:hypothetical protein
VKKKDCVLVNHPVDGTEIFFESIMPLSLSWYFIIVSTGLLSPGKVFLPNNNSVVKIKAKFLSKGLSLVRMSNFTNASSIALSYFKHWVTEEN